MIDKLINRNVYNKQKLTQLKELNEVDIKLLQRYIEKNIGVTVPKDTLAEIALNKLLTCYSKKEIIQILQYFGQLPEVKIYDKKDTTKRSKLLL